MTIAESVLAGICIALVSAILTKLFTKSIGDEVCLERRNACRELILEKIDALHSRLDSYEEFKRREKARVTKE